MYPEFSKNFQKKLPQVTWQKWKILAVFFQERKLIALYLSQFYFTMKEKMRQVFFHFFLFFLSSFFYLFFCEKFFKKIFFIFRLTFAEDTFLMHFCRSLLHCQVFFLIFLFFKIRNQKRYFFLFVFLKKIFLFFLEKGLTFWAPWIIIEVRRKNKAFPFRNEKNNKPFFSKSQEKNTEKN